jgi:hypothetical protein
MESVAIGAIGGPVKAMGPSWSCNGVAMETDWNHLARCQMPARTYITHCACVCVFIFQFQMRRPFQPVAWVRVDGALAQSASHA